MKQGIRLSTYEEIIEKLKAAQLELSFYHLQDEEMIKAEEGLFPAPEMETIKDKKRADYYRLIEQNTAAFRKRGGRKRRLQALKKGLLAACVVIAIVSVSFTAVVAFSPEMQTYMSNLLVERSFEFVTVGVQVNGPAAVVPEGWAGEYFPSYIPEGFELMQIHPPELNDMPFVRYINGDRLFDFDEMPEYATTHLAGEEKKVSQTTVHDREAVVIEGHGYVEVAWAEFDRYFIVGLTGTVEEAITIARSVERIK